MEKYLVSITIFSLQFPDKSFLFLLTGHEVGGEAEGGAAEGGAAGGEGGAGGAEGGAGAGEGGAGAGEGGAGAGEGGGEGGAAGGEGGAGTGEGAAGGAEASAGGVPIAVSTVSKGTQRSFILTTHPAGCLGSARHGQAETSQGSTIITFTISSDLRSAKTAAAKTKTDTHIKKKGFLTWLLWHVTICTHVSFRFGDTLYLGTNIVAFTGLTYGRKALTARYPAQQEVWHIYIWIHTDYTLSIIDREHASFQFLRHV